MLTTIKIAAIEALIALVVIFVWGKWNYHEGAKSVKQQAKVETKYVEVRAPEITKQIEIRYKDRIKVVHEKGDEIVKRVPVYVTKQDDSRCVIDTGFVRLWNDANKMQFSDTTSFDNETASPVVLTDVAAQHAKEAKQYNELYEQMIFTQQWLLSQQKLYKSGADGGH